MRYAYTGVYRIEDFGAILFNTEGNLLSVKKDAAKVLDIVAKGYGRTRDIIDAYQRLYGVELPEAQLLRFLGTMENEHFVKQTEESQTQQELKPISFPQASGNGTLHLKTPLMANIHLSYKCNQYCVFCYAKASAHEQRLPLPARDWIGIVRRLVDSGLVYINVLGGEPLLYFDEMMAIFETFSPGIHCTFATNGTANGGLTVEQAKRLARLANRSMRVSIHGYQEDHDQVVALRGAYQMARNSVAVLIRENIHPRITLTVTKRNVNNVLPLLDDMQSIGVRYVELAAMQPVGRSLESNEAPSFQELVRLKNLIKEYDEAHPNIVVRAPFPYTEANVFAIGGTKLRCSIFVGLDLDPFGNAYPCHLVLRDPSFVLGNLLTDPVDQIWEHPIRKAITSIRADQITNPRCATCDEIDTCRGGCKLAAYTTKGSMFAGDPSCPKLS